MVFRTTEMTVKAVSVPKLVATTRFLKSKTLVKNLCIQPRKMVLESEKSATVNRIGFFTTPFNFLITFAQPVRLSLRSVCEIFHRNVGRSSAA